MKNKISSYWYIAAGLIVIKLLIHFLTSTIYELHRDEMLYFAMGNHLDFGYVSTPPFVGFLTFLARMLLGYSEFGIKLFPALAGAASIVVIALFVKELGGKNLALIIAGIAFIASGAFLRSNSLFQPVSFDQFFWLFFAYLVLRMINTSQPKLWLWIAVVVGLAFLNKYSIIFFAAAMIIALLISRHRKILFSKYFLYGILMGLIIILPNLLWQHFHHWPIVRHMTELQRYQLSNNSVSGFFFDQLLNSLSSGIIWIAGLMMILFLPRERKFRLIAFAFLLVLIIIVAGRGKSYYTLGAYTMLFAAGGYAMEKYFKNKLVFINYLVILLVIITSLFALPLELPYASFETVKKICDPNTGMVPQRWEDGEIHPIPQDYADMTGWKELTSIVARAYNQLDENQKEKCTIYAENYGQAGAIEFYGHSYGLPKPISFHDSYLLWAPDSISDGPFIYINDEVGDMDELFNDYPEIGRVNNEYFRENGIMVLLCTNPKEGWKEFYARKVHGLKSKYY
ncbi:MAG TPA: glycosyltransferase family 39 protein [Bacteroidales bacterium]|nr:glycosyltransferase family 39 protein [Bacteroidales bacterium]